MKNKWLKMLSIMLCLVFVFSIQTFAAEEDLSEAASELKSDMSSMIQDVIANLNTKEEAQEQIDTMISQYASMYDEADLNAYFNYLLQYVDLKEEIGEYVEEKDFTCVEEDGNITSATLTLKFKNCDVEFTYAADSEDSLPVFNLERVSTFGEKMQKAALNTLMGMGTVFIVLIFISLLIACFSLFGKKESKEEQPQPAAVPQVSAPEEAEEDVTDDLELVAVISAAIAAAEGTSAQGFQVRSIKRVKKSTW